MPAINFKSNSVILFQGDSITDAGRSRMTAGPSSGDDLGFGYARLIADRLHSEDHAQQLLFYNRGVSGDRIKDMAHRWERDSLHLEPDLVNILIGVNDTWNYLYTGMGSSPEEYLAVFRQILKNTRASLPDIQLVLCEPFILATGEVTGEWEKDIIHRQTAVRTLAAEFDAVFIPFQSALDSAAINTPLHHLLDDGVHPTEQGHRILADCWIEAVLS